MVLTCWAGKNSIPGHCYSIPKSYLRFKGQSKFSTMDVQVAINTAISGLHDKEKFYLRSYEPSTLPIQMADENTGSIEEEQLQNSTKPLGN